MSHRPMNRALTILVSGVGAAVVLAACLPAVASAHPLPASTRTGSTTATGSLTLALTQPVQVSGTTAANVTCKSSGRTYHASVKGATINGATVSTTISVAGYHGPGSYSGIVTVAIGTPTVPPVPVPVPASVPTTITTTGGGATFSATGTAGAGLVGTLSWVCSS